MCLTIDILFWGTHKSTNDNISKIKATIVPHAGYFFSGKCAGKVYSILPAAETYILIGVNHNMFGEDIAISLEDFETPLGTAKNDTLISENCETSSSATLYSNIASYGNGTYLATFYATGSWYLLETISETIGGNGFSKQIFDDLGFEDATFYAILFAGFVTVMFLITPALAIIGLLLGILGASALGFTVIDYSIFIGISIVGMFIFWLAKR